MDPCQASGDLRNVLQLSLVISLRIGAFLISLSIAVFMLTFKYVEMANGRIDRKTLSRAVRT